MLEFKKVPKIEDVELVNIKAIIFDMDGTLLDSELLHAKALSDLLGRDETSVKALLDEFVGVAEPDVFKSLVKKKTISEMSFEEFVEKKNHSFKAILENESLLKEIVNSELLELISSFRQQNYKIALVTASEREVTDLFMNKLNLSYIFDIILTRNDTEKSKPDPMPYLKSFEELGILPSEALIFEDSPTGIESAISSGGSVCKANWYA